MPIRSLLFVPGDSERKLQKADAAGADVLILDLEDSVSGKRTEIAQGHVRAYLDQRPRSARAGQIWIRPRPVQDPGALKDLAATIGGAPDAILLPKPRSGSDVTYLDHILSALEAREGLEDGAIDIVPTIAETPDSLIAIQSFMECSRRLSGFSWGPIDLAAALHATTNRASDGSFDTIYAYARGLCIVAARAASVEPIDTICAHYKDEKILIEECAYARRSGFTGKLAIHPDQVEIINRAFMPSAEEIAHARSVIDSFRDRDLGAVGLRGEMLDMPHLVQARQILKSAGLAIDDAP